MIKAILLSLVIVPVASVAVAEVKPGSDVVLFGGVSHSNFTGSDQKLLGDNTRTGSVVGLGFMLRVNEDFGFEADLRLAQKGGEGTVDITDYTGPNNGPTIVGEGTTRLTYLEIPLMLVVTLPTGEDSYLRAFGGPSANVLTSANFEGTIEGQDQKIDLKDGIKGSEFALVFGAGWCYDVGEASLWLDGRWDMGLSSIDDSGSGRTIKNQSWQFALGVGIPLAR